MIYSGVEGLLEQASKWESYGEYAKAVDSYVKIMPSNMVDKETATKCWMKVNELNKNKELKQFSLLNVNWQPREKRRATCRKSSCRSRRRRAWCK